jgi:hypothetical protein
MITDKELDKTFYEIQVKRLPGLTLISIKSK